MDLKTTQEFMTAVVKASMIYHGLKASHIPLDDVYATVASYLKEEFDTIEFKLEVPGLDDHEVREDIDWGKVNTTFNDIMGRT